MVLQSDAIHIDNIRKASAISRNCLFCRKFSKCKNPEKKFDRICDNFKKIAIPRIEKVNILEHGKSKSPVEFADYDPGESTKKFINQIDQAIKDFSVNPIPVDLKIDDRDLPVAKNFIEFCSPEFLNVVPRAKQAQVAINSLAEYCPVCSDGNYVKDIPIADTIDAIKERVVLLEHGVCPECGRNRSQLYKKGLLKVPVQVAGLAGQRCVVGDTLILTTAGYIKAKDLQQEKLVEGLQEYTGPDLIIEDGSAVSASNIYYKKDEKVIGITLSNGMELKGRPEHPIQVYDIQKDKYKFKKLKNIKNTDIIPYHIGINAWGTLNKNLSVKKMSESHIRSLLRLNKKCARKAIIDLLSIPGALSVGNIFIVYVTKNKNLSTAVSLILNKFGVNNRLITFTGDNRQSYCVVIYGGINNIKTFIKNIGDVKKSDYFVFESMLSSYINSGPLQRLSSKELPLGIRKHYVNSLRDLNNKLYPKFLKIKGKTKSKRKLQYIKLFHILFGGMPKQTKSYFKEMTDNVLREGKLEHIYTSLKEYLKINKEIKKYVRPVLRTIKKIRKLPNMVQMNDRFDCPNEAVYDFQVPDYNRFIGNGIVNHNSGKTALSRMMCAYGHHRYLKLPNGAQTYNVLESEILYSQLIAITWTQSKELLYDGIYEYLTKSPWFMQYNEVMKYYGNKYGEELIKIKDTFAAYKHKKLYIAPYGPDKRKLRGRTGYLSAIDELSWLVSSSSNDDNMVKINGEEIYTAMSNTFETLVPQYYKKLKEGEYNLPPPLLLCTSSPTSKKDMTCRLVELGENSNNIYSYCMSTWEMNPEITRESLDDKFKLNYAKAMRDFGAVPPNSMRPYISSLESLKGLVNKRRKNTLRVKHETLIMPNNSERTCAKVYFNCQESPINHAMSIDAGFNNNSFSITIGYYDEETDSPVVDGIVEIIPVDQNTPISFNAVYTDVICPIIKHMNVALVITDRWQNIKLLSDLESEYDVAIETHSPKYKLFDEFRTYIEIANNLLPAVECKWSKIESLGEVDYPHGFKNHPVAHLLYQMITVQDMIKDVTKGDGTTDDTFRALINLYNFLIDENYRELVSGGAPVETTKQSLGVWGSIGSNGGGAGNTDYRGIGLLGQRK